MKKILFISHDASRTGAPMVLLYFLKWLKQNEAVYFETILLKSGPLFIEFNDIAPTHLLFEKYGNGIISKVIGKIAVTKNPLFFSLKQRIKNKKFDLIYANTSACAPVLEWLCDLNIPYLVHVHEMKYGIQAVIGEHIFKSSYSKNCRYIAVSNAVKTDLVYNLRVKEDMINVIYAFVDINNVENNASVGSSKDIRVNLGIPSDAFIIGAAGGHSWRKGSDLFVQLVKNILSFDKIPNPYFLWVGGSANSLSYKEFIHDIKQLGLTDRVITISSVANPFQYFKLFDVFTMISREDPFPLVNIETAALQIPIVCFDNAGGTPELVEQDAGFVVPYLDIDEMADKITFLYQHPDIRKQMGIAAAKKVKERYDAPIVAEQIYEIINQL